MRWLTIILVALVSLTGCATEPSGSGSDPGKAAARAKAHTELAIAYFERAQYKIALDELGKAIEADSRYAPAYNVRGLVHMTLQEDSEAEDDFQRSLNIDAEDPDSNINYGWFLCQRGHEKEAIGHFMVAAKDPLYPAPEKAYLNAGLCSKKAGNRQEAEKYFQRALLLRPNLPDALVGLAEMAFINADYAGASSYFIRFEKATAAPLTAENLLLAVRIERGLGDLRAAASYATRLKNNFPDSREAQLLKQIR